MKRTLEAFLAVPFALAPAVAGRLNHHLSTRPADGTRPQPRTP